MLPTLYKFFQTIAPKLMSEESYAKRSAANSAKPALPHLVTFGAMSVRSPRHVAHGYSKFSGFRGRDDDDEYVLNTIELDEEEMHLARTRQNSIVEGPVPSLPR